MINRLLSTLTLIVSINAHAFDFFGSQCHFPLRLQSFSFGAAESFGSDFPMPEIVDQVCWQLGKKHGQNALNQADRDRDLDDCYDAYDYGVEQGFKALKAIWRCLHIVIILGYNLGLCCYQNTLGKVTPKKLASVLKNTIKVMKRPC